MPATRKPIPAEKIAEARYLYEQTNTPIDKIAALLNMSRRTFCRRVDAWGWTKRKGAAPRAAECLQPRHDGADAAPRPPALPESLPPENGAQAFASLTQKRKTIAARILAVVERSIDAVETTLDRPGGCDRSEADAAARRLACLARTVREMRALEATQTADAADDDAIPRDLDELRRTLAEKLERIVGRRSAGISCES